jgi:hypothetical protein
MVGGFVEVEIVVAASTHQDSGKDYLLPGNFQILLSLYLFLCCVAFVLGVLLADYNH